MNDSISSTGFIPPDPSHLADLFPGYQIVRLIACGGMGAVYEAVQIALDRNVAIKILPREFTNDESFRIGFQAEARAMARLNHPNLISVYDFGEVDGMLFIIMEYVPGFSLFQAANGQPILQHEVIPLVSAICHGLAHAHENGIIHRDIKPANILLNLQNEPKIGDFGLARPLENQLQEGEDIFGTPGYTAPEVLNTPHSIDHRADIFSLGVLLYELLTGLLPSADSRPASAICHCDPRLDLVIRKATHPLPAERYHSAIEIASEIEKISTSAGPRILQTAAPVGKAPRVTTTKYTAVKKSGPKGFFIFLLLVVIGFVGFHYLQKLNETQEVEEVASTPIETQPIAPPSPPISPPPTPSLPEDPVVTPAPDPDSNLVKWGGATHTLDQSFGGAQYSVKSGDINGQSDSGIFQYEIWEGDGVFTLEISPIASAPSNAKAGLMIRENLEADARNALLARNSNGETILQIRLLARLETLEFDRIAAGHRYLRIHRNGERITAEASRDGDTWAEIGTVLIPELAEQIFVGFAAASASHSSAESLNGRFQPVKLEKFDPSLEVEGGPLPRINMNELFRRARSVMKERAAPYLSEFQQQIKANNENYIRLSRDVISQLSEYEQQRATAIHSEFLKAIEIGGFIGTHPPAELAKIPVYLALHNASVERQKGIRINHAAKMSELQEVYLNGLNNQIQRSNSDNDLGAVKILEVEKERVLRLPHYFPSLMQANG